jgi:hypothetical protein
MLRASVTLIAIWGNDDAESQIKISPRLWAEIQAGATYSQGAWSHYEGRRYHVRWSFKNGKVSIDGEDDMQKRSVLSALKLPPHEYSVLSGKR